MSELTQVLQVFSDFKDEMNSNFQDMKSDIKEIKTVLAGDEFGNEGLVKSQGILAAKLYAIRDDVKTMKVIGGVLYGIIGIIIGILTFFSKH